MQQHDHARPIRGLADSKVLAESTRMKLAGLIREKAVAWAVARASVEEIDALNILQATLLAMRRAVEALAMEPEEVCVDGLHTPQVRFPCRAIVDGDARVRAISAHGRPCRAQVIQARPNRQSRSNHEQRLADVEQFESG